MALGSKKVLIDNALTMAFGSGFSLNPNLVKVPVDVDFSKTIRHFDTTGLSFLTPEMQLYTVDNGYVLANVKMTVAGCHACGKVYYRIEDIEIVQEYIQNSNFGGYGVSFA